MHSFACVYFYKIPRICVLASYLCHIESLQSLALIKLKAGGLTALGVTTVYGYGCSEHTGGVTLKILKCKLISTNTQALEFKYTNTNIQCRSYNNTNRMPKLGQKYCKTLPVHKTCRGSHYKYF